MHLEGMRDDGEPIPDPASLCDYVDVELPVAKQKLRKTA